jgi:trk system potassium uptake protein TrkH
VDNQVFVIGASPASTGGGIKTTTAAMVVLFVSSVIRGRTDTTIGDRRIPAHVTQKSMAVAVVALFVVLLTVFALLLLETASFEDLLFEAVSAFGTVGLSRGVTSGLTTASKAVMVVTMFSGRVGVLTLILALIARKEAVPPSVRFPEGNIIVG